MPMIIAVVMDERGRPLCCEMWPGNTTTLAGWLGEGAPTPSEPARP